MACPRVSLSASTIALILCGPLAAQDIPPATARPADSPAGLQTFDTVHVTAEAIARQALGASTILADDIQRQPPRNDIAEFLRTLPGVNLTGNSTSGQRAGCHRPRGGSAPIHRDRVNR